MTDPERVTAIGPNSGAYEFDPEECTVDLDATAGAMIAVGRKHWYDVSPPQPVEVVVTMDGDTEVFYVDSTAYGHPYVTMTVEEL